jgi:hypothetical protein
MEKVVNRMINDAVEGVDTYKTKDSTWLIFTESKRWVIELTKDGTLWYNYNFFRDLMMYLSMDVVENQHYITKWVENNVINKVEETSWMKKRAFGKVENIIQNGVKETKLVANLFRLDVEDTIQNGVKETNHINSEWTFYVEDTIENGVKETQGCGWSNQGNAENAIKNGVKYTTTGNYEHFLSVENKVKLTNSSLQIDGSCVIEDVIENGIKETCCHDMKLTKSVEKIIQKGIKNTYSDILPKEYDWSNQFDVQEVIDNGVKHTEYGDWEDGDKRLDDIIQNGIKETLDDLHHRQREVVQTIKEGIKETIGEDYHHKNRIDGVIKNGVKETLSSIYPIERVVERVVEVGILETKSMDEWVNTYHIVNEVMNNGIKEVQPLPAQDGNRDWGNYYHGKKDITKPHTEYVNDVLDKGEKI